MENVYTKESADRLKALQLRTWNEQEMYAFDLGRAYTLGQIEAVLV